MIIIIRSLEQKHEASDVLLAQDQKSIIIPLDSFKKIIFSVYFEKVNNLSEESELNFV